MSTCVDHAATRRACTSSDQRCVTTHVLRHHRGNNTHACDQSFLKSKLVVQKFGIFAFLSLHFVVSSLMI